MNKADEKNSIADQIPKWYEGARRENEMRDEAFAQIRLLEEKDDYFSGWNDSLAQLETAMLAKIEQLESSRSITTISRELSTWLETIERLKMKHSESHSRKEEGK